MKRINIALKVSIIFFILLVILGIVYYIYSKDSDFIVSMIPTYILSSVILYMWNRVDKDKHKNNSEEKIQAPVCKNCKYCHTYLKTDEDGNKEAVLYCVCADCKYGIVEPYQNCIQFELHE